LDQEKRHIEARNGRGNEKEKKGSREGHGEKKQTDSLKVKSTFRIPSETPSRQEEKREKKERESLKKKEGKPRGTPIGEGKKPVLYECKEGRDLSFGWGRQPHEILGGKIQKGESKQRNFRRKKKRDEGKSGAIKGEEKDYEKRTQVSLVLAESNRAIEGERD